MRQAVLILIAILSLATPSQAQLGPLEDIIEDIIIADPNYPPGGYNVVETIPVFVKTETLRDLSGHSLVINAYKPVQPGMTQPELIGQTRILLNGMPQDFALAVMVPEPVTRDLDFAVINGAVLDDKNQEVMVTRKEEFYRGRGTVELEFVDLNSLGQTPKSPPDTVKMLKLEGKAYLPNGAPDLMRGASMTVELIDLGQNGLPGGAASRTVISQTFVDLDKEKSPFKFKLEFPDNINPINGNIVLRAYIIDWAGRRLYQDDKGQSFRGKDDDYKISLEPVTLP